MNGKKYRRFSTMPRGLRYKLMVAFSLMSIIPLLVCGYLVISFIFPNLDNLTQVSMIVVLSISIAFLGLLLAKRIVDPIIDIAVEARIIANGDYSRSLAVDRDDEIGELGKCINSITKRIKDSIIELQDYSIKTKEVNLEIQKKVLVLSSLLQISDMISANEELDSIFNSAIRKICEIIEEGSFAILFLASTGSTKALPKTTYNIDPKVIRDFSVTLGKDYIGSAVAKKDVVKIDSSIRLTPQASRLCKTFDAKNILIVPLVLQGASMGFILAGNNKNNYKFKNDDIELIKILSKQLGIAIENDKLIKKAEELAIKDDLTGLYNEKYLKDRLDEEIKRSILYQRPCSLLLFDVDNFKEVRSLYGDLTAEGVLKKISSVFLENCSEVCKIGRVGLDEFAILLPEKNKKEATTFAETLRKVIENLEIEKLNKAKTSLTVSGGVSENPIDGTTADELFIKARSALQKAKSEGKNRVVA